MSNIPHRKIQVLVVDDSAFMRQVISNAINSQPDMQVLALARNGQEAVQKVKDQSPDVVTLDVEMPVLSGLGALEQIMQQKPTPVIMVSGLTTEGAQETLQALEKGAVDFIAKPDRAVAMGELADVLATKVRLAAGVKVFDHKALKSPTLPADTTIDKSLDFSLLLIGCSTGGPAALSKIVPALPRNFPLPVIVAQHMPVGFTGPMAERLNQHSNVRVVEAAAGMEVVPGTVYIAPAGCHTGLKFVGSKQLIAVAPATAEPGPYRPSVNYLFRSAVSLGPKVLAMVLTGMGQDGLEGSIELKNTGATIMAESAQSAVIYGMPRAIVEKNLADRVLSLPEIVKFLGKEVFP